MKKYFAFVIIGIMPFQLVKSQWVNYMKLKDQSITNHYKRMVFEKWAEFYPKPVYRKLLLWEVNTSFNASMVWGDNFYGLPISTITDATTLTNTKRNRLYRDGEDIRPLKPNGKQSIRVIERQQQKELADKIKKEVEVIRDKAIRDFAHQNPLLSKVDPMWLLYYKLKLKSLSKCDEDDPTTWGFKSIKNYNKIKEKGIIPSLKEKITLIKYNLKTAQTSMMPRGKRMLMYHKCLVDWKQFQKLIHISDYSAGVSIDIEKKQETYRQSTIINSQNRDVYLVKSVMSKYKNKY